MRLKVRFDGRRSRLDRLFQEGSAKARFPAPVADAFEAALINTAGGMTGGDRFSWSVEATAGARALITTQACEKIYRSEGGDAEIKVRLKVARGAALDWLPQETILFVGARARRSFDIQVEPGGRLLAVEGVILGRHAMGETAPRLSLSDRWQVQWGERLIFADNLTLEN